MAWEVVGDHHHMAFVRVMADSVGYSRDPKARSSQDDQNEKY